MPHASDVQMSSHLFETVRRRFGRPYLLSPRDTHGVLVRAAVWYTLELAWCLANIMLGCVVGLVITEWEGVALIILTLVGVLATAIGIVVADTAFHARSWAPGLLAPESRGANPTTLAAPMQPVRRRPRPIPL